MLVLNESQMWQAVTLDEVLEAVEDAFAIHRSGRYLMPDRSVAEQDGDKLMFMPCFLDSVIGTKMLAEFPKNPEKGLPYLSGLVILNNRENGQVQAILNGGALTAMRTGAVGGVGIRYLAPESAERVGLVGCGVQGFHQLLYACHVRKIREVRLFDAYKQDLSDFIGKLIQLLQHQHGNPGIVSRQNPLYLRVIPVIILNHRPEICSPVVSVHQLQLIYGRARIPKGPVDRLHRLILRHPVQVNLYKRFAHIFTPPASSPARMPSGIHSDSCVLLSVFQHFVKKRPHSAQAFHFVTFSVLCNPAVGLKFQLHFRTVGKRKDQPVRIIIHGHLSLFSHLKLLYGIDDAGNLLLIICFRLRTVLPHTAVRQMNRYLFRCPDAVILLLILRRL